MYYLLCSINLLTKPYRRFIKMKLVLTEILPIAES